MFAWRNWPTSWTGTCFEVPQQLYLECDRGSRCNCDRARQYIAYAAKSCLQGE